MYKRPLEEAIGIDYIPGVSWAADPDLNDFWPDGPADYTRTINKIINSYFSQDLENRTYRNFGMNFYNTLDGRFQPQSFTPKPFGMYGVPGNPDEIIKQMKIEPLNDTKQSIEYLKNLVQSSLAQTPTERGEQAGSRTTLGEIQLDLRSSGQRNAVVSKQYQEAWERSGQIWYDLMKNNYFNTYTLEKEGPNGESYKKEITPNEWKLPRGYGCKVLLRSQKEQENNMEFNKVQYVQQAFPDNPVAQRIAKRKTLEIIGWKPNEIEQVMAAEEKKGGIPGLMVENGQVVDPNSQGAVPSQMNTPLSLPAERLPVAPETQ